MSPKRDAITPFGAMPSRRVLPLRADDATDAVAAFLDDALAERDLFSRMHMVAEVALASATSPALQRALEAEAQGRGRLRRRAIALFALGKKSRHQLNRIHDGELVTLVLERQMIAWEKAMMEADGPSRSSRESFLDRDIDQQVAIIEALTESEEILIPGTVAFMEWLAAHARHGLVRSEATAILAEDEERDWQHEALDAMRAANLEHAARAYELAARTEAEGLYSLERGLCLCAAGDLDEAAEAFEQFLALNQAYPLREAVEATIVWLRKQDQAYPNEGDDDEADFPFPLALPFLREDPVAEGIEQRAATPFDAMVQRATWGLALVALGERLGDGEWDAGAWAEAVGWVVERLRQGRGEVRTAWTKAARDLPPPVRACVARLVTALRLDGPTAWLMEVWRDLLDAVEEEGEQADEEDEEDEEEQSPGASGGVRSASLEATFMASLPEDERTEDRRYLVAVAEHYWREHDVAPAKVDDTAVCEALGQYAAAKAAKGGAADAQTFAPIAVDTALRLAAFLASTLRAPVNAERLATHRDELTRLTARLIAANAAAIEEIEGSDDRRNVLDELSDLAVLSVEQVKPGRVWVRHLEFRKAGVIATRAGLDQHLVAGDFIVGALAKAPTGRYVLTTVELVVALPAFVLPRARQP